MEKKSTFKNPIAQTISNFLWSIGIPIYSAEINVDTFLPGIRIIEGAILVDEDKMLSAGDILHEAGHLAILSPETRKTLTDTVVYNEAYQAGEEMAAIAWSWAAMKHLGIAPEVVFHPEGYKGGSDNIIENFEQEHYFGVPVLAYKGLCFDGTSRNLGTNTPFPKMIKWTAE